ncbi:hypothetical protein [Coleofasciculus sp. FACHB-1120]|uniref:hypothetical protein n=1 Tax=Coleofasciculus sp. FACHB-1120 TaxID=2692783 RepID=UPI001682E935|nr:hypothetical protein [Coleofasciculus sp. FACHB-1120]MBD2741721.1 hypothetical protein [Coleofasciculus sp. FACHB-1120]
MFSNQPKHVDAVGADNTGSGFLTPDAGPDTARADYSEESDLNDATHDYDNVDEPVPDTSVEESRGNVVDRQMRIIGRTSG